MHPPQIITLPAKQLVGQHLRMSITDNKTRQLWQGFRPRVKEIKHVVPNAFFSVNIYDHPGDFATYTEFEKWAAVEVTKITDLPEGMENLALSGGAYAVFIHKGEPRTFPKTFQYIFHVWLPQSEYEVDDRPHFEILDHNYRPDDPEAEEEVWIPVRKRA